LNPIARILLLPPLPLLFYPLPTHRWSRVGEDREIREILKEVLEDGGGVEERGGEEGRGATYINPHHTDRERERKQPKTTTAAPG